MVVSPIFSTQNSNPLFPATFDISATMATVTSLTDVIQTYISAHGKKAVYEHLETFLGITIKKKRSKTSADGSDKPKRAMSAFAAFVKHLRETEGSDAYTAWKTAQEDPKKALWPGYASHVRTHRPAEWSAFEASYKAEHPSASFSVKSAKDADNSSVASSTASAKPKKAPKAEKAEKPKKASKPKKAAKPAESDTESESDSETSLELIRIDGTEYYLNAENNQIFAKDDTDKAIGTLNEDGDGINLFA